MDTNERPTPIESTRCDDPELQEEIGAFVVGLGERLDGIQDAEHDGEFRQAGFLAQRLSEEALRLGFPPLSEAAVAVHAASVPGDPEALHKQVVELTGVVQRIRLGHRGSA